MNWICGRGSNPGDALTLGDTWRLEYRRMRRAELRAARANRDLCTDEKRIRTENTVMINSKQGVGLFTRSPIARGCAFHPYAIGDPRGRLFVRAKAQL
jgi:hypothetical protein